MKQDSDDQFTILPKVMGGRRTKELSQVAFLLFIFCGAPLGVVAVGKVYFCKRSTPKAGIWECLRGP